MLFRAVRECRADQLEDATTSATMTSATATAVSSARPLYIVTPTYTRATQLADLTRLANTLRLVPGVHWLVAEDSNTTSEVVEELLTASGLSYTQLAASRPRELVGKVIGRGVFNRYIWLREIKVFIRIISFYLDGE